MSVFEPVIDELHRTAAGWEPVNDSDQASAQKVRILLQELPEVFEALSGAIRTLAGKATDSILFAAGAADLLAELETYARGPVDALREVAAGVDQAHRDDVDRIQHEDPRIGAWDWSRNQDVS